ncbi:MAG: hypothetical protein RIK87_05670, partial [Fuerstiella sp.]
PPAGLVSGPAPPPTRFVGVCGHGNPTPTAGLVVGSGDPSTTVGLVVGPGDPSITVGLVVGSGDPSTTWGGSLRAACGGITNGRVTDSSDVVH